MLHFASLRTRWPAAAAACVVAACSGPTRPVAIGLATSLQAPNAGTVAELVLDSARTADQPAIRIETGDSGDFGTPGVGTAGLLGEVDKALRLASLPGVMGVVGPPGSREALQAAPIYRDAELPNVVPTATSRLLHDAGPWTFMLAPDDSVQGEFIGGFASDRLHARSAVIFYIVDEYGLGLASGTAAALARRGIPLLGRIPVRTGLSCLDPGKTDPYDEVVAAALAPGRPDVVILATRTIETACIARAITARVSGARFVTGDGTLMEGRFIESAGPAADSLYLVGFWHPEVPDTASRLFAARFRRLVHRDPRHDDAMTYDGVMLLAAAIQTVGPDRRLIRRYLDELGGARPPYPGITGPIAFTPGSRRPLLMMRIRNGGTHLLSPP